MSDIVERLRASTDPVRHEAANEIERLQSCLYAQESVPALYKEIERLRAENQAAWNKADELDERARHAEASLRRALEPKP